MKPREADGTAVVQVTELVVGMEHEVELVVAAWGCDTDMKAQMAAVVVAAADDDPWFDLSNWKHWSRMAT